MRLIVFSVAIFCMGSSLCCKQKEPAPSTYTALPLPLFNIEEVDQELSEAFKETGSYEVKLDKSKSMRLADFLTMIKNQLNCPNDCEAIQFCEKDAKDKRIENCSIQWSKKMEPNPGQDVEPNSIWTLEYRKSKSKVDPTSLFAFWKDY